MPIGLTAGVATGLGALGIGAATAASAAAIVTPLLVGAGTGALVAGVTGGDPGMGALFGAGTAGVGSALGSVFGSGLGSAASGAASTGSGLVNAFDAGTAGAGAAPSLFSSALPGAASTAAGSIGTGIDLAGSTPYLSGLTDAGGIAGTGSSGALSSLSPVAQQGAKSASGSTDTTSKLLGLIAAASAATSKPQQGTWATPGPASTAATQGPYFNAALNTNVPGRTQVDPSNGNPAYWYTYGSLPPSQQNQFYTGNSLKNFGWGTPPAGMAKGGSVKTHYDDGGTVAANPFPYDPSWTTGALTSDADVNAMYENALGRMADPTGLASDVGRPSGDIWNGILSSPEYLSRLANVTAGLDPMAVNGVNPAPAAPTPDTTVAPPAATPAPAPGSVPTYKPNFTPFVPAAPRPLPGPTAASPPSSQWFDKNGNFIAGQSAAAPSGNGVTTMAHGGALNGAARMMRQPMAARGGRPVSTRFGDHLVPGDSGGQDDQVDAKLSPGEWIMDANFVSALGDGSNAAGSKALYKARAAVMRDKGMKGPVPPKLKKSPLQYLVDARK